MQFTSKSLMLATPMKGELTDYKPGRWLAQPKWDGHRMVVTRDISGSDAYGIRRNSTNVLTMWQTNRGPNSNYFQPGTTLDGEWLPNGRVYVVFDVLEWDGVDLRHLTLDRRLAHMYSVHDKITKKDGNSTVVMVSPYGEPDVVNAIVQKYHLEGLVLKRRDSKYTAGRSPNWQKYVQTQHAVWTFYVLPDEPKLVLTTQYMGTITVAVSEQTADSLRQTLPKVKVESWFRYDMRDTLQPTGNGLFKFWGWKQGRSATVPRYPQFVEVSVQTPYDGTYRNVVPNDAQATLTA